MGRVSPPVCRCQDLPQRDGMDKYPSTVSHRSLGVPPPLPRPSGRSNLHVAEEENGQALDDAGLPSSSPVTYDRNEARWWWWAYFVGVLQTFIVSGFLVGAVLGAVEMIFLFNTNLQRPVWLRLFNIFLLMAAPTVCVLAIRTRTEKANKLLGHHPDATTARSGGSGSPVPCW